jgi:hypothetical protein
MKYPAIRFIASCYVIHDLDAQPQIQKILSQVFGRFSQYIQKQCWCYIKITVRLVTNYRATLKNEDDTFLKSTHYSTSHQYLIWCARHVLDFICLKILAIIIISVRAIQSSPE